MHKIFLALILLSIPVSTNALAHSGTEQDENFVHRTCGVSVAIWWIKAICRSCLPQGKSTKTFYRVPPGARQPRAMTIGLPFGVGALPSPNNGARIKSRPET